MTYNDIMTDDIGYFGDYTTQATETHLIVSREYKRNGMAGKTFIGGRDIEEIKRKWAGCKARILWYQK